MNEPPKAPQGPVARRRFPLEDQRAAERPRPFVLIDDIFCDYNRRGNSILFGASDGLGSVTKSKGRRRTC